MLTPWFSQTSKMKILLEGWQPFLDMSAAAPSMSERSPDIRFHLEANGDESTGFIYLSEGVPKPKVPRLNKCCLL